MNASRPRTRLRKATARPRTSREVTKDVAPQNRRPEEGHGAHDSGERASRIAGLRAEESPKTWPRWAIVGSAAAAAAAVAVGVAGLSSAGGGVAGMRAGLPPTIYLKDRVPVAEASGPPPPVEVVPAPILAAQADDSPFDDAAAVAAPGQPASAAAGSLDSPDDSAQAGPPSPTAPPTYDSPDDSPVRLAPAPPLRSFTSSAGSASFDSPDNS